LKEKAVRRTQICKKENPKKQQMSNKTSPKTSSTQDFKKRNSTKNKPKFARKPQGWSHCSTCGKTPTTVI